MHWLVWRKYRNKEDGEDIHVDVVTQDGNDVSNFSSPPTIATAAIDYITSTDFIIDPAFGKRLN